MTKQLFLTLVLLFNLSAAFAVDIPPGTNNIQAYINNAAPGATLNLQAGTYYVSQTITVNKSITIQGTGMNTIIQKTNGTTADIAAIVIPDGTNNVTLKNFRLLGQDQGGPGIMVFSDNNHLVNVNVSDCGNNSAGGPASWRAGILLDGAANNELTDVKSHHNSWVGISQNNSPGTTITGADCFLNHGEGLTIDLGSDNCIVTNSLLNENNVSTRGVGGIGIDDVNGASIQNCTINDTHNLSAITFQNNVGGEEGCIIKNNIIHNSAQNGVRVKNCVHAVTNTTISDNDFSGNGAANVLWECGEPVAANDSFVANNTFHVRVYPNPAAEVVTIDCPAGVVPIGFQLFTLSGQQVLQATAANTLKGIDVSRVATGVYLYKATHSKGTATGKLIVN